MENETTEGYKLMIEFPDQSPSFAHGFSMGRLYEQLLGNVNIMSEWLAEESIDLVKMICGHFGYTWAIGDKKDGWVEVTIEKGKPRLELVR